MERDARLRAEDLDRYWDAVLRGSPPLSLPKSVPDLTDLVNRLHAARGPAPTLFPDAEQAWRELRRTPIPEVRPWPHPNGREAESLERRTNTRSHLLSPRWMAARLATAAVLLLSLIGFVFVRQQSLQTRDEAWTPALVQALASVSGEVVDQVLVDAKFTAEELPAGNTEATYYRMTLQPGVLLSSLNAPAWCGCRTDLVSKGVGVEVVQSGSYSLRLDAPIRVQRNGAREVTTVPAQTEVVLGPGDAVIFPDYAATGEIRNAGDDPADLIGLAIFGTEDSGISAPPLPKDVRMELLTYALPHDWDKLPAGPIAVSVRRLTLPPGESVGPYEPVGLEAMLVEQGTTYRYFYAPGEGTPGATPLYRGKGQVHPIVGLSSGVRTKIDIGDEPVQLLVVLIEPAGISFESLAP